MDFESPVLSGTPDDSESLRAYYDEWSQSSGLNDPSFTSTQPKNASDIEDSDDLEDLEEEFEEAIDLSFQEDFFTASNGDTTQDGPRGPKTKGKDKQRMAPQVLERNLFFSQLDQSQRLAYLRS